MRVLVSVRGSTPTVPPLGGGVREGTFCESARSSMMGDGRGSVWDALCRCGREGESVGEERGRCLLDFCCFCEKMTKSVRRVRVRVRVRVKLR